MEFLFQDHLVLLTKYCSVLGDSKQSEVVMDVRHCVEFPTFLGSGLWVLLVLPPVLTEILKSNYQRWCSWTALTEAITFLKTVL